VYGEAETRPPLADGKGVMLMLNNKLPHTLGAERRRAACRKPANPANLRQAWAAARVADRAANVRQGAERGRAPWPRPRRHRAVSGQEKRIEKVFIKNLQDVAHSSFELYPESSAKFYFFLFRKKIPNSARAKN